MAMAWKKEMVSIAGAILWGEQRGDTIFVPAHEVVSIAGAILWGEQHEILVAAGNSLVVSIAGGNLWVEQPCRPVFRTLAPLQFQ